MPGAYDNYMRMANSEMEHANYLHEMIGKLLEKHDAHSDLHAVWAWQNERFMRWATKIRAKMEAAKRT